MGFDSSSSGYLSYAFHRQLRSRYVSSLPIILYVSTLSSESYAFLYFVLRYSLGPSDYTLESPFTTMVFHDNIATSSVSLVVSFFSPSSGISTITRGLQDINSEFLLPYFYPWHDLLSAPENPSLLQTTLAIHSRKFASFRLSEDQQQRRSPTPYPAQQMPG